MGCSRHGGRGRVAEEQGCVGEAALEAAGGAGGAGTLCSRET